MTSSEKQEIEAYINAAIKGTIKELKREGFIGIENPGYMETLIRLNAYYQNDLQDEAITEALQRLQNDKYIDIIPLFYYAHNTIAHIANLYDVDASTITRNKKRLCLEISKYIT